MCNVVTYYGRNKSFSMESRVRGNSHARFGLGENSEITSKSYLSTSAAYAVVAYQTAYLKYYYPLEYMASLMSSVMGNVGKISEYILSCRQMGLKLLPPSVNEGESNFSVSEGAIRYGLSAIKSVSHTFIKNLCEERKERGKFINLTDFLTRMAEKEINKRVVENLIKSGALDNLGATRKQSMMVYAEIMEGITREKKNTMIGQMTLFDFAPEEKSNFDIKMPEVGEYSKEEYLAFEKEVLGIYVSGHPLEEYEEKLRKNITRVTTDFLLDEETGQTKVKEGEMVMVGGMIVKKTIKYTKRNQIMAFITLEDLVGTLEVVIFPKDYEKNDKLLNVDEKVFVRGHVSTEEEKNGKLICEKMYSFKDAKRELWLQFDTREEYQEKESKLMDLLRESDGSDGNDNIIIYISTEKQIKRLPKSCNICVTSEMLHKLSDFFGEKNVKVKEKSIENLTKRY